MHKDFSSHFQRFMWELPFAAHMISTTVLYLKQRPQMVTNPFIRGRGHARSKNGRHIRRNARNQFYTSASVQFKSTTVKLLNHAIYSYFNSWK